MGTAALFHSLPMFRAANQRDPNVAVQSEHFSAIFGREPPAINLPGFRIENMAAAPSVAVLGESPKHLQANERTIFLISAAEIAGGIGNGRIDERLDGSEECPVLFANGDDRPHFAGVVVNGLPSPDWRIIRCLRQRLPRRNNRRRQYNQRSREASNTVGGEWQDLLSRSES